MAVAFVFLGLQGCYSAARVDPSTIQPGAELSIHLTEEGVTHLMDISTQAGDEVAGQLQSLTADSLTISTRLRQPSATQPEAQRLRQSLTFSRDHVRDVTVPRLSKGRTAGIVLAAAVLVGFVLKDVLGFGSTDTRTPTPPDGGIPLLGVGR